MDYQIAIPSYKRTQLLKDKTLATLKRYGVDNSKITVFVANEDEHKHYEQVIGKDYKIVVGVIGLSRQRKFIHGYYAAGTRILFLDDDVADIRQKKGEGLEACQLSIDDIAAIGFGLCERHNAKLWGINAVANGFFLKDTATIGLKYICGIFFGCYAGDPVFVGPRNLHSSGEDFENTILSYKKYGAVVRIDWLCPLTKYFADGGIVAELADKGINNRNLDHTRSLMDIAARHPDVASTYEKAGEVTNLRLRHINLAKYERQSLCTK